MRAWIAVAMTAGCIAACSSRKEAKIGAEPVADLGEGRIGEASTRGAITVFPVLSSARVEAPRACTLDEAIAKGTCAVREQENGGAVNALVIANSGDAPVYLLGGEIVQGGQQDRVIAED